MTESLLVMWRISLCKEVDHNLFYQLKPLSQIWEGNFGEKSKCLQKQAKSHKYEFSNGHRFSRYWVWAEPLEQKILPQLIF